MYCYNNNNNKVYQVKINSNMSSLIVILHHFMMSVIHIKKTKRDVVTKYYITSQSKSQVVTAVLINAVLSLLLRNNTHATLYCIYNTYRNIKC